MCEITDAIPMPRADDDTPVVILAGGDYPEGGVAVALLARAQRVVCCDGAALAFAARGGVPHAVVGDCDSLDAGFMQAHAEIIHCDGDQQTNDLTKAVKYCVRQGMRDLTILGGTGAREDHTLANISLLADYMQDVRVRMVTGSGVFDPIAEDAHFESFTGQQVSIFTLSPQILITTENLRYPLCRAPLTRWWQGSLNESQGARFGILTTGPAIIYRLFG